MFDTVATMDTSSGYSAFISYSHTDDKWAEWLQRALETYRLPVSLRRHAGLPAKLKKVFRDREELATGQNLGEHLQAALASADTLIVICSPASRDSKWVNQEIEYFKSLGKGHRIFCLLVDGGAESFAPGLLEDIDGNALEPLAADPRETADGKTRAKLKIIAGMLDLNLDDLARREATRKRQQLFWMIAAGAAVLAITLWGVINQQAQRAQIAINLTSAMTTADYIDSRRENLDMTSLGFASDLLQTFMNNVGDIDALNRAQTTAIAKLKRTQGLALYDLGQSQDALELLTSSRDIFRQSFTRKPGDVDAGIDAALAEYYLASTLFYERDFQDALGPMRAYVDLIAQLYKSNPANSELLAESVFAPRAMLKLLLDSTASETDIRQARDAALQAIEHAGNINGNALEIAVSSAQLREDLADYHMRFCEVAQASNEREEAVQKLSSIVRIEPENRLYRTLLANTLPANADLFATAANYTKARMEYVEARKQLEKLQASDPANEYLKEKIFLLDLDLFSLASYHPYVLTEESELRNHIEKVMSDEHTERASKSGKEALLTLRRIHYALSIENWTEAQAQSQILGQMTKGMSGEGREYYRIFYSLQQKVLQIKTAPTEMALDIPVDEAAAVKIMADQSCPARFYQWATHVIAGDSESADSVAVEAWNLGLRGQEIAFYAGLLDIEHPPKGTVY